MVVSYGEIEDGVAKCDDPCNPVMSVIPNKIAQPSSESCRDRNRPCKRCETEKIGSQRVAFHANKTQPDARRIDLRAVRKFRQKLIELPPEKHCTRIELLFALAAVKP